MCVCVCVCVCVCERERERESDREQESEFSTQHQPYVEFLAGFMRDKWLDDEIVQIAFGGSYLELLIHLVGEPLPCSIEVNVDFDET